mgnify:CR=1 FL=1
MSHTYLRFPAAPNLPLAPVEWNSRYQDQFANVLRLYFNQLSQLLQELGRGGGGYHLSFPHGAFHQNGNTTLSANITNNSTTPIQVASTAGFPSSGWILIESEIISYTTKTATTFDGTITRGVLGTTNVAHTAGAAITEVQGTGSPTAIGKVLFNNTDYSNGVYTNVADQTKVYFDYTGVYNLQFSAQLLNYTTTDDNVTIWFSQNGTDVPASASIEEVNSKHGTSPGARICTVNILLDLKAGDYITLNWTSDTGNSIIGSYPAGTSPVHPVSPGLIFTATFVSAPQA